RASARQKDSDAARERSPTRHRASPDTPTPDPSLTGRGGRIPPRFSLFPIASAKSGAAGGRLPSCLAGKRKKETRLSLKRKKTSLNCESRRRIPPLCGGATHLLREVLLPEPGRLTAT